MGKMSSFEVQEGKLDYQQIFNEVKKILFLSANGDLITHGSLDKVQWARQNNVGSVG
jgi:hypothetical protein